MFVARRARPADGRGRSLPNSLISTAVSASAGSLSSRLSSVVLPAPRKPVSTVSGRGETETTRAGLRGHWVAGATLGLGGADLRLLRGGGLCGVRLCSVGPRTGGFGGIRFDRYVAWPRASWRRVSWRVWASAASVALAGAFFFRLIRSAAASAAAASAPPRVRSWSVRYKRSSAARPRADSGQQRSLRWLP